MSPDNTAPPPLPESEQPKKGGGFLKGCFIAMVITLMVFVGIAALSAFFVNKFQSEGLEQARKAMVAEDYDEVLRITSQSGLSNLDEILSLRDEALVMKTEAIIDAIEKASGEERKQNLAALLALDPHTKQFPDEVAALKRKLAREKEARRMEEQERITWEEKKREAAELAAKSAQEEADEALRLDQEQRAEDAAERMAIEKREALNQILEVSADAISDVSWSEYDAVFNIDSKYTKLQKDEEWKRFKGKTVEWTGEVFEVSDGVLGGLTLQVKMNRSAFTSDVIIRLRDEFKPEAMKLKIGDQVTFRGELFRWGEILPSSISNGIIVDF